MANRYASQQHERSVLRASVDLVVACTPMTSLVAGLGLGVTGYLLATPAIATAGAGIAVVGVYVERLQARSLRRRRRSERMRSRHEVTELRRTIAQLRLDVDAFQRALLDAEAVFAPRPQPPLPAPVPVPAAVDVPPALPAPAPVSGWFQTAERGVAELSPLPAQHASPFVAAVSGSLPVLPELPPRRSYDTGGIPILAAPPDRLSATTDALVHAALDDLAVRTTA